MWEYLIVCVAVAVAGGCIACRVYRDATGKNRPCAGCQARRDFAKMAASACAHADETKEELGPRG